MIGFLSPLVFIFTVLVAKLVIVVYNFVCKRLYDQKIDALMAKKQALEVELAKITGKKKN
jgi:hypothetical protein